MAPAQRVSARQPKDVRAEFDLAFRRFSQSMDMLLPDQRALAYNADLRWLGKIRGTARARYRDDRLDLASCQTLIRCTERHYTIQWWAVNLDSILLHFQVLLEICRRPRIVWTRARTCV